MNSSCFFECICCTGCVVTNCAWLGVVILIVLIGRQGETVTNHHQMFPCWGTSNRVTSGPWWWCGVSPCGRVGSIQSALHFQQFEVMVLQRRHFNNLCWCVTYLCFVDEFQSGTQAKCIDCVAQIDRRVFGSRILVKINTPAIYCVWSTRQSQSQTRTN